MYLSDYYFICQALLGYHSTSLQYSRHVTLQLLSINSWIMILNAILRGTDSDSEIKLESGKRSRRPVQPKICFYCECTTKPLAGVSTEQNAVVLQAEARRPMTRWACVWKCVWPWDLSAWIESQKHSLQVVGHYKKHHYKPLRSRGPLVYIASNKVTRLQYRHT